MRRFRSVFINNFLTLSIVVIISFLILGASFALITYHVVMSDSTDSINDTVESVNRLVSSFTDVWDLDGIEMRTTLMWISEMMNIDILITNEEGVVVSCSDSEINCSHIGQQVSADIIQTINSTGEYNVRGNLSGLFAGKQYLIGTILESGRSGSFNGFLFLFGESSQLSQLWRNFVRVFILSTVVVLIIFFILNFFAVRNQSRPLREMAEAAHKFERGDFSVRVNDVNRDDEIGDLVFAFNKMADSLEKSETARRDLISNVSHELKTPMTTITGYADGILDGTIPSDQQRDCLQIISSETKRLSRLVRGMLDMSQIQSQENMSLLSKSFDLCEVIRLSLLSLEQKITKRGLDVDVSLPEDAVMTVGEQDSITQVVYNLIDNATKFAAEGSTITLELWKQDDKAFVSVKDQGETIPKEELPLIFDRFHKTDHSRSEDKEGVGLGLYIVKTILDSHGGDIFVTSQDGVTNFTFCLNLKKEP